MNKQNEVHVLNVQLWFSFLSILSIVISIFLLKNEKAYLKKERPLLKPTTADYLSKFNRILILIIALVFLSVNYRLKDISANEGEDLKSYNLQIIASYLVVISAIITLYVVFTSPPSESTTDVENPII